MELLGTLYLEECKTSTISPPMISRSLWSWDATSIHQLPGNITTTTTSLIQLLLTYKSPQILIFSIIRTVISTILFIQEMILRKLTDLVIIHVFSLAGEWNDNKKSLLEFIWAAHWGVKGVVRRII